MIPGERRWSFVGGDSSGVSTTTTCSRVGEDGWLISKTISSPSGCHTTMFYLPRSPEPATAFRGPGEILHEGERA